MQVVVKPRIYSIAPWTAVDLRKNMHGCLRVKQRLKRFNFFLQWSNNVTWYGATRLYIHELDSSLLHMRPWVGLETVFLLSKSWRVKYSIPPLLLQLVLLKTGGQLIYSGPLGQHSSRVIEYFEVSLLLRYIYLLHLFCFYFL